MSIKFSHRNGSTHSSYASDLDEHLSQLIVISLDQLLRRETAVGKPRSQVLDFIWSWLNHRMSE